MTNLDIDGVIPLDYVYSLFYYPSINRFTDEDGHILQDLSDSFDVWQLDEWKQTQKYGILTDRKGGLCELYYASPDDDEYFVHHSWRR